LKRRLNIEEKDYLIPAGDGSLDEAMEKAMEDLGLSNGFSKELHFFHTNEEVKCRELSEMLQHATKINIIIPNSYDFPRIRTPTSYKFILAKQGAEHRLIPRKRIRGMEDYVSKVASYLKE